MSPFREVRKFVMAETAGPWYGQYSDYTRRDDDVKRPVNLLRQFVRTYLPNLCGPTIKAKVSPKTTGLRSQARLRELMLDHLLQQIRLAKTWRLVVRDVLMGGLGIVRTGLRAGGSLLDVNGEVFDVGQPYAVRVDLDDFVRDPQSRDPLEDTWRAFRYRVSRQDLLDMNIYDHDLVMGLPRIGEDIARGDSDKIMGAREDWASVVDEKVELWDVIYYAGDRVLEGTLAGLQRSQWLREPHEYEGREGSPLTLVSVEDLPNNAMPVSPCASILDMHLAMSAAATKMTRQILKTKRHYIYKPEGEDTAMEMQEADDQEFFKGDPTTVNALDSGGLLASMVPAFDWLQSNANNETGALQLLSGSDDVSKTATTSAYLQGNANVLLSDMRGLIQEGLREVVKSLAWYMDTDPRLKQTFTVKMENGAEVDVVYDAAQKEGDFADFLWDVDPVADTAIDPSLKMRRLSELMTALPQFMQSVQMLGGDVTALVEVFAKEYSIPELEDVFPTQGGVMMAMAARQAAGMPMPGQPGQPAQPGIPAARPTAGARPIDHVRSDMAATVPA